MDDQSQVFHQEIRIFSIGDTRWQFLSGSDRDIEEIWERVVLPTYHQ